MRLRSSTVPTYGRTTVPQTRPGPRRTQKCWLDELENTAKEAGVSFTPYLVSGHPGGRIVSTADEIDTDLIVVGSLVKSHLDRLLLGSVSAYVTQ
ncbi:MAG: universal stress protein, partial [Methanocorpusculum sp.]|nr:universal stress protein [Methanocorpusculum sp.]